MLICQPDKANQNTGSSKTFRLQENWRRILEKYDNGIVFPQHILTEYDNNSVKNSDKVYAERFIEPDIASDFGDIVQYFWTEHGFNYCAKGHEYYHGKWFEGLPHGLGKTFKILADQREHVWTPEEPYKRSPKYYIERGTYKNGKKNGLFEFNFHILVSKKNYWGNYIELFNYKFIHGDKFTAFFKDGVIQGQIAKLERNNKILFIVIDEHNNKFNGCIAKGIAAKAGPFTYPTIDYTNKNRYTGRYETMYPVLGTDNFVSQDYKGYRNDHSNSDDDSDNELYG